MDGKADIKEDIKEYDTKVEEVDYDGELPYVDKPAETPEEFEKEKQRATKLYDPNLFRNDEQFDLFCRLPLSEKDKQDLLKKMVADARAEKEEKPADKRRKRKE
jgi:hypothetical protein